MILPYGSHPREVYKRQVSDQKDTHHPEFLGELLGGLHVASTLLMVC